MSKDGKNEFDNELYRDQMISECLIRITALENLLISKEIVTDKEIQDHIKLLSEKISDLITGPISLPESNLDKQIIKDEDDKENDNDLISNSEFENIFKQFSLTTKKISKGN